MSYRFAYATVRQQPRKVINVVRAPDELLEDREPDELADEMRDRVLVKQGEHDAAIVTVQDDTRETLRLPASPARSAACAPPCSTRRCAGDRPNPTERPPL